MLPPNRSPHPDDEHAVQPMGTKYTFKGANPPVPLKTVSPGVFVNALM